MKGDIIFPKNCIIAMPWHWKLMANLLNRKFMKKNGHQEKFDGISIELSARSKHNGQFLPTPFFLNEHLSDGKTNRD